MEVDGGGKDFEVLLGQLTLVWPVTTGAMGSLQKPDRGVMVRS